MKQFTLTICSAAILFFSCNDNTEKSATVIADTSATAEKMTTAESTTPPAPPDSAAMMKAWQDFMTPGDNHKWLEKSNGTWEAEVTQWMDPAAPPTKAKAVNVQSSMLGGRYVISKFTSTMMGQPMEGMSTTGYDNGKKMFVSTWIDNLGTGIVHMSGNVDAATNTLNLKGHQTDPMTGKDSEMREEMKMIDDNTYTMTLYGAGMDGKEMKFMEGTFKKKK
ncbi:MAG: DUF1579 domain-containing protein [Ferruginibacter sp.]|nr:DUF1579 domain-containing protein [Ferruginibacter sp.]